MIDEQLTPIQIISQKRLVSLSFSAHLSVLRSLSHLPISFWMKATTSSLLTVGLKNWTTSPLLLTKNLAKFQGITLAVLVAGSKSVLLLRRKTNTGCVFSPFTSTFSMIGNPALKLFFTKASISSGLPLSCPKNWLHGKARISKPCSRQLSCAFTMSLQFSEVSPHLQATFTTIVNFFSLRHLKSNSLPRMSRTLKSKKLGGTGFFRPSAPDLKTSLDIRPPINKQSIYFILRIRGQERQEGSCFQWKHRMHHLAFTVFLYTAFGLQAGKLPSSIDYCPMKDFDVRKIVDSRQVKDRNGYVGREFRVLWKDYGGEEGTWQKFENLFHCKKALRSYYNAHPQLPYPNALIDPDDQDFHPGTGIDPDKKVKGRPSKARLAELEANGYSLPEKKKKPKSKGKAQKAKPAQKESFEQEKEASPQRQRTKVTPMVAEDDSGLRVLGLFTDAKTNEVIYRVAAGSKHFYRNRKWVMDNCKESLIDFYERCIVLSDK